MGIQLMYSVWKHSRVLSSKKANRACVNNQAKNINWKKGNESRIHLNGVTKL